MPGQFADRGGDLVVGGQRADVDVVRESLLGGGRERVRRLVAEADDARAAWASPRVKNAISAG